MISHRKLADLVRSWPDHPARFRALAKSIRDWPTWFAAATDHGVLGVLRDALGTCGIISPTDQENLERRCVLLRLVTRHAWQSLEETLKVLNAATIRAVVLKGPLLGQRLHGENSLRPSCDHDLLVADHDLDLATAALATLGYELEQEAQEDFFRTQHHHVHLMDRFGQKPMVELHYRLSSNFGVDLAPERYLERSLPFQTRAGIPCRILHPEDEFFYLAVHAAGHHFARLGWLVDLQRLLARHPEIDLPRVAEHARQARLLVPYLSALDRLRRLTGVEVNPLFARQALLRRWLGSQLQRLCELLPDGSWLGRCASLGYQVALCDRFPERLRLLRRRWNYQWA